MDSSANDGRIFGRLEARILRHLVVVLFNPELEVTKEQVVNALILATYRGLFFAPMCCGALHPLATMIRNCKGDG
jgi:hypothetical protein